MDWGDMAVLTAKERDLPETPSRVQIKTRGHKGGVVLVTLDYDSTN